jgi:asparagine synthase (glutamine-hydrolysing)
MCGIAGVITSSPSAAALRPALEAAATALRHRGPDDFGITLDGPVGFVHTRLSIIDLAGGHQPIVSPGGELSAVVNGEIYNYVELRDEFSARLGVEPLTHSDSESVLQVYAAEGIDGLRRLNGMFALAIHDRAQRRVVLARDRLGIKPMYVYADARRVVFGSELKALLPLLPAAPELNADAIAQFLENEFLMGEQTAFAGISRVPPGHALTIDYGLQLARHRYWSIGDVRTQPMTMAQAREAFTPLFEQVMREHMRADVPFGLFLSGGVDSSLLCAMLTRMHDRPIESFSVGYSVDRKRNELDAAQSIARRFGTQHHALEVTPAQLLARIPHAIWSTDELMRDFAILPTSLLAERTGQSLKVVFTGEGGDEAFAGYARYRKPAFQRFLSNLVRPGVGGFRTRNRWPRSLRHRVYSARLLAVSGGFRKPQFDAWRSTPAAWSDLQRAQHYDLVGALPDKLLVKVDRSLMAFGVEARVPYLDHRIVEFGLALPDALKVQGRVGKVFLRQWGQRHIEGDHLMQNKQGFHVPMRQVMSDEFLQGLGPALAASPAIKAWFDTKGVTQLVEAQRRTGHCTEQVWGLMQFAIWHRIFVERGGQPPGRVEDPLDWIR